MIRLIGLYREREYSPGRHQSNDARLLEEVRTHLRGRDFDVELTTIDRLVEPPLDAALVFSMCQGRARSIGSATGNRAACASSTARRRR